MKIRITIAGLCLGLMLPFAAVAKKPVAADGCAVLVPAQVSADAPFTVTVSKEPAYPGQWFAPTVTVEVVVPVNAALLGPNSYSQTVTQTIDGLGGDNNAKATFVIPVLPNLDVTSPVNVFATVSEPVRGNSKPDATCTGVTSLM
jgi:hypothetical protein